jgi:hypothetical protein
MLMSSVFGHEDFVRLERQFLSVVRDVAHTVTGMNLEHHSSIEVAILLLSSISVSEECEVKIDLNLKALRQEGLALLYAYLSLMSVIGAHRKLVA